MLLIYYNQGNVENRVWQTAMQVLHLLILKLRTYLNKLSNFKEKSWNQIEQKKYQEVPQRIVLWKTLKKIFLGNKQIYGILSKIKVMLDDILLNT